MTMELEKRSDVFIGQTVQYSDSGTEVEVVSEKEADGEEYESDTDVFVKMGGIIQHTDVSELEPV